MSTTLAAYMDREGINDADFASSIGRDRSMVNKLRRGVIRPTLELAAAIEQQTAGEITMRSWLRHVEEGAPARPAQPQPTDGTPGTNEPVLAAEEIAA